MRRIELEALTYKLNARQIERLIIEEETLETAIRHLSKLSNYQRLLILLRFGLCGEKAHTSQELGKWFGISHQQILIDLRGALSLLKGPQMQKGKSK